MTLIERAITVFATLALLTSCAAIREYRAEYQAELRAEDARRAQTQPPKTYEQKLIDNYLDYTLTISLLSTLTGKPTPEPFLFYSPSPYTRWPTIYDQFFWLPTISDQLYQYESMLRMERFKLEMQMRLLMDELKSEIAKIKK